MEILVGVAALLVALLYAAGGIYVLWDSWRTNNWGQGCLMAIPVAVSLLLATCAALFGFNLLV